MFIPDEASVTSPQTITGNRMDHRERRSVLLMRNAVSSSPSAAAWLEWGPAACWHDRLDVDYSKPSKRCGADSRWASVPRSPGCGSLVAAPRRACWSSPWWWRCSSSWGCSRGLTSSSSASYSTRLKAQLQRGRDEDGWHQGSWKLTHVRGDEERTQHRVLPGSEAPTVVLPWGYFNHLELSSRYNFKKCPTKEE